MRSGIPAAAITIPAALAAVALTAAPIGIAAAAPSAATAHATQKTTTRTYVGPSVDMQWGPVQVTVVLKGKMVTDLRATAPTERARSAFINQQAIPMLRQEVLQARTAAKIRNIYGISGATMTSEAFYQSLLAALHQARLI